MTVIFRAKSQEAYCIKIIAELLANNIKTGCFVLDETGISLCMMDHHRRVLIDMKLDSESPGFSLYKFQGKKMFIGINLNHFHKMLKSIKKKDSIELFIDDVSITDLGIKVIPKENNRITTSFIKIQSIQNLDIDLPETSNRPIVVSSSEIQKMLKDFGNIGSSLTVTSKNFKIKFSCNAGGILKRNVEFGEGDEDEEEVDDSTSREFCQEFNTEQLCRITKLSGLSNNIQIYPGKPLRFSSNIGTLGKISIYIKSKEQLDSEQYTVESDYDTE
jgi:proliferating cell nuclear antigen PCNA